MALMPLNQHGRADGTMPDATELPAADHAPRARDRRAPRVARPVPTGALQGAPSPQSAKAWGRLQFRPPDRSDCRVHAFHTWRTSVRGCMAIVFEGGLDSRAGNPAPSPEPGGFSPWPLDVSLGSAGEKGSLALNSEGSGHPPGATRGTCTEPPGTVLFFFKNPLRLLSAFFWVLGCPEPTPAL